MKGSKYLAVILSPTSVNSSVDRKIKICMNKFLTIITLIIFSLNLCKSQKFGATLKQSFERAENLNLPLLIVRYHQAMVDYPKTYNTPTSDSILDSIMAESKINPF
ncbi:MAG: hypothetical protein IPJ13_02620 [Saprospiraceae bacterium]|nr:hypothetical protein [Saprospiraceae bacterium]